jgi:hypothetical protein
MPAIEIITHLTLWPAKLTICFFGYLGARAKMKAGVRFRNQMSEFRIPETGHPTPETLCIRNRKERRSQRNMLGSNQLLKIEQGDKPSQLR